MKQIDPNGVQKILDAYKSKNDIKQVMVIATTFNDEISLSTSNATLFEKCYMIKFADSYITSLIQTSYEE